MDKFDKISLLILFMIIYLTLIGKIGQIASDIKIIRTTITAQVKQELCIKQLL
jgi:hypothetical protein